MSSKPTSEETFLNSFLIDGKERIRISKQDTAGQKLWKNWQINGTGFMRWLFTQLNIPPASLQLQSDWNVTNPSSVQFIKNKPTSFLSYKSYTATISEAAPSTATSGLLFSGETYTITAYVAGDDFSNVATVISGTINTTGCVFITTGTTYLVTPTDWSNGSTLDSAGNPRANVLSPNGIGDIVWTRNGTGDYFGTLNGAFPSQAKTFFLINCNYENVLTVFAYFDTDKVMLQTYDLSDSPIDSAMSFTSIEIRVYS